MNLQTGARPPLSFKVSLSKYTSMKTGGEADYFALPVTEEELLESLAFAREHGLPHVIIGRGSNVIFPDDGYPGLVISMARFGKGEVDIRPGENTAAAPSGISLFALVKACQSKGLAGSEFLATIPGSLGGALVMNAGFSRFPGQLNQIGDLVEAVTVLGSSGTREIWPKGRLKFEYRKSNLAGEIILGGVLRLWRRPPEAIAQEIEACLKHRKKTQNIKYPSAGSVFKNPPAPYPKVARLIDELGLKGTRVGDIMISDEHCNYFVNLGQGKSSDVIRLIEMVQEKVFHEKGIMLEPEVKIIPRP